MEIRLVVIEIDWWLRVRGVGQVKASPASVLKTKISPTSAPS